MPSGDPSRQASQSLSGEALISHLDSHRQAVRLFLSVYAVTRASLDRAEREIWIACAAG